MPTDSQITPEVVREHNLTPEEYQKIVKLLGRAPTLTELGIFSVMWSEHCSYKSSRVHLKRLPTRSRRVVQGPGENAGIIDIGDGWACAFKIESHNHPSFIEPFQGAATGVGGILRDIFTMGARPVAVMDSLRFGPIRPGNDERDVKIIHRNHSILEGVVSGIAGYGNCFGVPNLGGETKFEPCYSQNPLVNAFALGLVRRDKIFYARASGEGNPVIYVGSKTGRDGIHGCTMASEEFSETSEAEASQRAGRRSVPGKAAAGGLRRSHGNRRGGRHPGHGRRRADVLDLRDGRARPRRTGDRTRPRAAARNRHDAYEIMLSESQERMLLVAEQGREEEVFAVFRKWGLDASTVGRVTNDGRMRVLQHGQVVAEIPNHALTDEAPLYQRPLARWDAPVPREKPEQVQLGAEDDLTSNFERLLASPNICSKRWITEQYESYVQLVSTQRPGGDAGVLRVKGTERGLAMALDGNGRWCWLDPRLGAMHAVAEAARNVACAGARPIGATNCLNFGNPEKPHIMWQFSQVVDGMTKACEELETPITGGNVSFYNETLGEGIYPTPVVGIVGLIEHVDRAMTHDFREARPRHRAAARLRTRRCRGRGSRIRFLRVRQGNFRRGLGLPAGARTGKGESAAGLHHRHRRPGAD